MSKAFNDEIEAIVKQLSKGLTKTEVQKLEKGFTKPQVKKSFEDPLTARKIIANFKDKEFKELFLDYPISAINSLDRRPTDKLPEIFRKK
jgi:hypothetical protein